MKMERAGSRKGTSFNGRDHSCVNTSWERLSASHSLGCVRNSASFSSNPFSSKKRQLIFSTFVMRTVSRRRWIGSCTVRMASGVVFRVWIVLRKSARVSSSWKPSGFSHSSEPISDLISIFQARGVKFDKGPRAHDLKERKWSIH